MGSVGYGAWALSRIRMSPVSFERVTTWPEERADLLCHHRRGVPHFFRHCDPALSLGR